ncbi:hypothetical protein LGQ02_11300 [Bacillus shivajii]|uniref:hypothetical protein n=1 Tax=Bacillus shivajii TaxID=1983719 RepID=UPI001CFC1B59|nr:hypothetical protein [Bacillus shivajii]UCZ51463.1 hypothetical protein LGQ02_11300 [Bacillus shivajii]
MMIKTLYFIGIGFIVFGLFNQWVIYEWKYVRGIEHWTGFGILLLAIIGTFLIIKSKHLYLTIIGGGVVVLAGVQFFMFAPLLNIASASFSFSIANATIGFYLTIVGALVICIFSTLNKKIIKST